MQKHSGGMEAGYGSRARHWNGIKSRVTGGWTSRDYNFPLISSSDSSSSEEDGASPAETSRDYNFPLTSSSDSSSSEEDGASPAERPDDQRMLSPRLGYFYRLFL